jgi:2-polyprenyl-3-methyl-5-hydroxy-6-metoxy-1,4-benzoquinol methylase
MAARWLNRRAPRVARVLRPAWWALDSRLRLSNYWGRRRHRQYYREVERLARAYAPAGGSVLDVGAADTELLHRLDCFARRVALDRRPPRPHPNIERVAADFMDYRPPKRFDVVLCLQVLEHLTAPEAFARKLLATGTRIIISVPYRWPAGRTPGHVQDPVDETMLARWAGQPPVETHIVRNGVERLIAVFRGTGAE